MTEKTVSGTQEFIEVNPGAKLRGADGHDCFMRKIELSTDELADVNMMITIAVTVSGKACRQELDDAFAKTVAAYDNLNTRVVIGDNG